MAIITLADVAPWVQSTTEELEADPLAPKVLQAASNLVNETVWGVGGQENYWSLPDRPAPTTATDIAEQLFGRNYSNPDGLQSETTGPMTERRAEFMLTGMALRPEEIERLHALRPGSEAGNGFWILSLHDTDTPAAPEVVDYVDAYGEMTVPGTTYFAGDYDHV